MSKDHVIGELVGAGSDVYANPEVKQFCEQIHESGGKQRASERRSLNLIHF